MSDKRPNGRKATVKNSTTSPRIIAREKKIGRALELRIAAKSFPAIAKEMGCSVAAAYEWVREGMERIVKPAAEELVQIELIRTEALIAAAFAAATKPGHSDQWKAQTAVLNAMQHRAHLLGLGKPDGLRQLNLFSVGENNKIELVFVPGPGQAAGQITDESGQR